MKNPDKPRRLCRLIVGKSAVAILACPGVSAGGEHFERVRQAVAVLTARPAAFQVIQPAAVPLMPTVTVPVSTFQPSYVLITQLPSVTASLPPATAAGPQPAGAEEAAVLASRYRHLAARLAGTGAGASPAGLGGSLAGGVVLGLIKAILLNARSSHGPGFNLRDGALAIFRGLVGIEADQPGPVRRDIEEFIGSFGPEPAPNSPGGRTPLPGAGTYSFHGTITLGERGAAATAAGAGGAAVNAHGLIEPASGGSAPR